MTRISVRDALGRMAIILLFTCLGGAQQPVATPESALLASLQRDIAAGQADALDRFWRAVDERKTPLVESLPGDAQHVLATFLWKDPGDTKDIVLQARPNGVQPYTDPLSHMHRLPGTNVWYLSHRLPNDAEFLYLLSVNPPPEAATNQTSAFLRPFLRSDPLNPRQYPEASVASATAQRSQAGSVARMPATPPNPWIVRKSGVPEGSVHEHSVKSATLNGERTVWVYTPPGQDLHDLHLLILFDGQVYINRIPTPAILDNLYAEHKIGPSVVVFLDNGGPLGAGNGSVFQ